MNRKEFGLLLSTLRQEFGWTQFQLAELADLDEAVISQIERGVKKHFEPVLLFKLANALQLTTLERREFILAASGLEEDQIVRQPAKGTTTDSFHPGRILDKLFSLLGGVRTPSFISDVYGDVIAANAAVIRFFNIPASMIDTAGSIPGGYNGMRMTFSSDLVARTRVSDHWDDYALSSMLSFRSSSLRYRAKPYFKYLMNVFRDPVEYPLFDRFWKRVSSIEQDKILNSDLFEYHHEAFGNIKYLATSITTATSFGELFLVTYQPLDSRTENVFSGLLTDGGNEVVRLAPWPEKRMI